MKTKKERLGRLYDELINKLSSKVEKNKLEVSQLKRELAKVESSFNSDIENIENTLSSYYNRL